MNSRQRVQSTLDFNSPDRAPRDLWPLPWVGQYEPDKLRALLAEFPTDFAGPPAFLGEGDRAAGAPAVKGTYTDAWGSVWEVAEDGVIGEVKRPPLADWADLDSYRPPWEVVERADFDAVSRAFAENLKAENPRYFLAGTTVRPFERMQFLRGSEALYMDLGYGSPEVVRLRDLIHEYELRELEGVCRTDCDGVRFMDDWGAQNQLLIPPKMWRELFKPLYARYCRMIHDAGKKVFFHSDGNIFEIYEDLIEVGVDAINSQIFCMDIEEIGRRFGGRITFWGEISRQNTLPFGTPDDVRRAVLRVRRALDDGRGGAIAQCEWGTRVSERNIRAVFEAWDMPVDELEAVCR